MVHQQCATCPLSGEPYQFSHSCPIVECPNNMTIEDSILVNMIKMINMDHRPDLTIETIHDLWISTINNDRVNRLRKS